MNSLGDTFIFTSFGESHGAAIGGVVDGVPANTKIRLDLIRQELMRRSGKGQAGVSPRATHEADEVEWLSGVTEKVENGETVLISLGTPIAFLLRNSNTRSEDYEWMKSHFRPGHADWTYQQKYGIRDWRGGGRASARETAARVVAGSIAKQLLQSQGITIQAALVQVGTETAPQHFDQLLQSVQQQGDTIGGIVECRITGLPAGVGEPIFDKLQAHLAFAMMSINGCKGFEYGSGFAGVRQRGSDLYMDAQGQPLDATDKSHSEGIYGGISDGGDIVFRCAFKPAATMTKIYGGRHDCCIAVRAVPVVEAMAALVLQNCISPIKH